MCSFVDCKESNHFTHMTTMDRFGQHWFCSRHWSLLSFFFTVAAECARTGMGCERNHKAEIDKYDNHLINTIKCDSKYWDLCDTHLGIYDEAVGIDLQFDFD
jgi:hypothetical protein